MQRMSAFLPSWDRTRKASIGSNNSPTTRPNENTPGAFGKVFGWAGKIAVPGNRLSLSSANAPPTRYDRETYWPTTLDKECDKAARILKSFCFDGFQYPDSEKIDPNTKEPAYITKKIPPRIIQNAVGLAVFSCMRSGLWMSGSGGAGLITARKADGTWSPPSGIILHTADLGFVIGVDIYDCVLVINSVQTLELFTRPRLILGQDVNMAVGPLAVEITDTVLTYLDGSLVTERTNENERFYTSNVGVLDILAGSIPKTIPEMRPLFEPLFEWLAQQPAPGDAVIETPKALTPATPAKSPFGIPDADDPDPFGIREFEYHPSPTSPIFSRFSRQSMDTFVSRSNRGSCMSAKTQGTAVTDAYTQTDVTSQAETSPSRANSDDGKESVSDKLPTVLEPEEVDYTKVDMSMLDRFRRRGSEAPPVQASEIREMEDTVIEKGPAAQPAVGPETSPDSIAKSDDELDEDADDEDEEEDDDEEEAIVICEVATAAAQPTRSSIRTSQLTQVVQAKGINVVTIPKRIPPPLPPRSPARTSRGSKGDFGDVSSLRSPIRNSFLSITSNASEAEPSTEVSIDEALSRKSSEEEQEFPKESSRPASPRHQKNSSSVCTTIAVNAILEQRKSLEDVPPVPQNLESPSSIEDDSEREPHTPQTETEFLSAVETPQVEAGQQVKVNGEKECMVAAEELIPISFMLGVIDLIIGIHSSDLESDGLNFGFSCQFTYPPSSFCEERKPKRLDFEATPTMSTQTGKFREEQVLIICPGSQTTLAQLGCNELTPPQHRFPTRMFRDEDDENQWRPFYTYKRTKLGTEDEIEYVEDVDSVEGAVYPIRGGHIVNMGAFLAFLEHVHSALTTTYHNTPIMLMASPQWTRRDCEAITGYVFEKTKTPALCLIHSGIATQYGLKWPHMTVVDVGYEKVDVTAIYDGRVVAQYGLGPEIISDNEDDDERKCKERETTKEISGGEVFTRKLLELLKDQGFDREMAEQLKKSNICEVLPYAPDNKDLVELPSEDGAAASTATSGAPAVGTSSSQGPHIVTTAAPPVGEDDLELNGVEKAVNEEGVLDVASLVVSGQTREFLAKKEKEKAEKAKVGRKSKGQEPEPTAVKAQRLPNSKRLKSIFHYEELVTEDVVIAPPPKEENSTSAPAATKTETDVEMADAEASAPTAPAEGENPAAPSEGASALSETAAPAAPTQEAAAAASEPAEPITERQTRRIRRDIEVGLERFQFADRKEIDRIVEAIYRTVQSVEDMYMRPSCWENVTFVGNGTRLRGLRDNIMQTLQARHVISPSSATMFTSELPSNIGTPSGTGSQTPTGSFTGAPHQLPPSGVNPLLQAATTASLGIPGAPGAGNEQLPSHHFHSQTPTNIKLAQLPTYLTEWTKNGFEEAMFLGAQVAARLAFCMHNLDAQGLEAQRLMSLSRVDFNQVGPKGIRTHNMLV
ncbi:SH3 domain-containing YSC84-like protein 1 [Podospora fimiseda]|uniref:SH3 domain-containing YSC84-like protein 1 n=1 Tax=Podospora fimiseda TaxID=252190 RepID=A0AAN7BMR2_9PEZI|nr:SH3 domain-containing YSC84-like protein 1 [Podospora fimiseda]